MRIEIANKKFRTKFKTINFNSKEYLESMSKNYFLLEKLIKKLKIQKIKEKPETEIDRSNYEQVVKKHKTEKKIRRQILDLDDEEHRIRYLKELAENKRKEIEDLKIAEMKKHEKLELLQKKAKIRQESLIKQKKNFHELSPLRGKPKHLEMEESYKINFEIPELERTKAELAKKKEFLKPLSRDDWVLHAKKYDEYVVEAKKKRDKKIHEFVIENNINGINLIRKAENIEAEEAKNLKKSMIERRRYYGELVKELFKPKIVIKSHSIEKAESKKSSTRIVTEKEIKNLITPSPKPKKSIKKKASKTPEMIPYTKFDYLQEFRNKRCQFEEGQSLDNALTEFTLISEIENKPEFLKKLQNYEKLANKEELKMKSVDPNSLLGLELEEKINELLMQSVKAKVNLLEHN